MNITWATKARKEEEMELVLTKRVRFRSVPLGAGVLRDHDFPDTSMTLSKGRYNRWNDSNVLHMSGGMVVGLTIKPEELVWVVSPVDHKVH